MMLVSLVALVISIKYYHRHRSLKIFTWYILSSLTEDAAGTYHYLAGVDKVIPAMIGGVVTNLFMLAEYIIFTYFMLTYISSVKRKWIIRISSLLFFAIMAFLWIKFPKTIYMEFFSLESLFLVLPCLFYFYELFMKVQAEPLGSQPAFWIVTGILFLNACSIPLSLTIGMMGKYDDAAYSLNYILYILLFILIIRAYLCKPESPVPARAR